MVDFFQFLIPSVYCERYLKMETHLPDGNKGDPWLSSLITDSPIYSYRIGLWRQGKWGVHKVNDKSPYYRGRCDQESNIAMF